MQYILIYSVYVLILSVLMGVSTWKLYKKMGYSPVTAFIPFYNYYVILKETKHPKWWSALAYFPIVGTIMMSVFHLFLMEKFGKKLVHHKVLTIFLPFLYMAFVNYSKETELEDENEYFYQNQADYEKETEQKDSVVGSLLYAVVFATVIHSFFQPFTIPTGSMERTLLVGDFLFVNKVKYGYRAPMRPVAIPFLQSTIFDTGEPGNPKDDPKSYVDAVKLPYFRLPAFSEVERNDIVVFNYPGDSVHTAIDRKDPYVKRAVAIAGDELEIKAGKLYINGKPEQVMGDAEIQQGYKVTTKSQLDIPSLYNAVGFLPVEELQRAGGFEYHFSGLTEGLANEIKDNPEVISVEPKIEKQGTKDIALHLDMAKSYEQQRYIYTDKVNWSNTIFPANKDWNKDWYGKIRIPKKGDVLTLNLENIPMYAKLIRVYENNILEVKGNQIFINKVATNQYEVKQNYYFMMGDNRDASLDSRYFGFVPETHIVGTPMFTWMSVEGLFSNDGSSYQANGKSIRWDRMFKVTNTGEAQKTSYWWVAAIVVVLFFGWDHIAKLFKKKKED